MKSSVDMSNTTSVGAVERNASTSRVTARTVRMSKSPDRATNVDRSPAVTTNGLVCGASTTERISRCDAMGYLEEWQAVRIAQAQQEQAGGHSLGMSPLPDGLRVDAGGFLKARAPRLHPRTRLAGEQLLIPVAERDREVVRG